jgi:luciferase family oxidoreductase group 1
VNPEKEKTMVPLSVLELALVAPDGTAAEAVRDVLSVAQTADACGYQRIWFAEHHASPRNGGSTPVVLIAHVAANTHRIRVGSGGVMLPNHAPMVVAEQFATLGALHGDRIDLGVGRASGGSTAERVLDQALRRDPIGRSDFPDLVDELLGFLRDDWPQDHPFQAVQISPPAVEPPGVFVLGVSENGARTAAERSLPFVYGYHLGRSKCRPAALTRYREAAGPYVIASVNVLCAESDSAADDLLMRTAQQEVVRANAVAGGSPLATARIGYLARQTIDDAQPVWGSPATVRRQLDALAGELEVDELMMVPYDSTSSGRCRTLRLVAGLNGVDEPSTADSERLRSLAN